jgi:hypothetical protein
MLRARRPASPWTAWASVRGNSGSGTHGRASGLFVHPFRMQLRAFASHERVFGLRTRPSSLLARVSGLRARSSSMRGCVSGLHAHSSSMRGSVSGLRGC